MKLDVKTSRFTSSQVLQSVFLSHRLQVLQLHADAVCMIEVLAIQESRALQENVHTGKETKIPCLALCHAMSMLCKHVQRSRSFQTAEKLGSTNMHTKQQVRWNRIRMSCEESFGRN